MNRPHKVFFVDLSGKVRSDTLGSRQLAIDHAKAYQKAGYENIVVFDVYQSKEIKFQ